MFLFTLIVVCPFAVLAFSIDHNYILFALLLSLDVAIYIYAVYKSPKVLSSKDGKEHYNYHLVALTFSIILIVWFLVV